MQDPKANDAVENNTLETADLDQVAGGFWPQLISGTIVVLSRAYDYGYNRGRDDRRRGACPPIK